MNFNVIEVSGLSKAYQLGDFSTGALTQDLHRWWSKVRGKEDPFLKIGETNDRSVKGGSNVVWSLSDVNFSVKQGDAVGIIGKNGAGKSTLLKLLSRVTAPTTGSIKVKGRIASLLEVGTGFHPELSGRENVFLNGAILGMKKHEIKRNFDEIVDFSGVERYIDTPVKRYSSGMYVRLAFGVAAYLESEILIVDEVLAVGDAEFQKKALGKMQDVNGRQGRTVLFVSHNMAAVKELCTSGIVLKNGMIALKGSVDESVNEYLKSTGTDASYKLGSEIVESNDNGYFRSVTLFDSGGTVTNSFIGGTDSKIRIEYTLLKDSINFNVGFVLYDMYGTHIYSSADTDDNLHLLERRKAGNYIAEIPLPLFNLNTGNYRIRFLMGIINTQLFDTVELSFSIEHENFTKAGIRPGLLITLNKWQYE